MPLPPGVEVPDRTDPHYRYFWAVQYDDLISGGWEYQLDACGKARSVRDLDWSRVVRIQLQPDRLDIPRAEVRVRPQDGEKAIKFWQVDLRDDGTKHVREVLGIQKNVDGHAVKFFVLIDEDGSITISTKQDI